MLQDILNEARKKFDATLVYLRSEFSKVRTSRANPGLIQDLEISVYETKMSLKELAAVEAPRPNLLVVSPWDQNVIEEVAKGLRVSSFNFNPIIEGGTIKVLLPLLSQEQREEYIKIVGRQVEEVKIAVRNIRREKLEKVEQLEKDKQISKDEFEWFKKQLQKLVDEYNEKIEISKQEKEKELMEI